MRASFALRRFDFYEAGKWARLMKDAGEVVNLRGHATRRQALQKYSPVAFGTQARVKHSKHTPVACAANQSPQALLQGDDRLRNAVFMETRSTSVFDIALPG